MNIKRPFYLFILLPVYIFVQQIITGMNFLAADTIENIACHDLRAARVLNKYGIDFCTEGKMPLKEACYQGNISFRKVIREIREVEASSFPSFSAASKLEIDALTRLIEKYHHVQAHEQISFIKSNMARVTRMYGKVYPEMEDINRIFLEMTAHLTVHMAHEEHILFPYIRKMVKQGRKVRAAIFRSVKSPIHSMSADHEAEDNFLKKLDTLTRHYTAPDGCCPVVQVTYQAFEEFERDLRGHIRLESGVLFPRALEMESWFNMAPYREN